MHEGLPSLSDDFRNRVDTAGADAAIEWLKGQGVSDSGLQVAQLFVRNPDAPGMAAALEAVLTVPRPLNTHISGTNHAIATGGGMAIGTLIQNIFNGRSLPDTLKKADLESYLRKISRNNLLPIPTISDPKYDAREQIRHALKLDVVFVGRRAILRHHGLKPGSVIIKHGDEEIRLETTTEEAAVMELIHKHRHLVVTGGPGMGKTCLLRYIALWFLDAEIATAGAGSAADRVAGIPVVISLRRFSTWLQRHERFSDPDWRRTAADPDLVWAFLAHSWTADPWADLSAGMRDWLAEDGEGRATEAIWFLIDGLDEVPVRGGCREMVARIVESLADREHAPRMLVTSRTRSYDGENLTWRICHRGKKVATPWPTADLLPFTPGNVDDLAKSWFTAMVSGGSLRQADGDRLAKKFIETVRSPEREDLAELAKVPLNATTMCLIH